MNRKFTFMLAAVATLGGAWSCCSMGQDPNAPYPGSGYPGSGFSSSNYPGSGNPTGPANAVQGESALAKNVSTLVKQLKSAEGAEKESVAQKLKSAVGEQFDFRHDAKAKELRALEEQLAKLKEIHNKRTQQRDRIVADRVQQILSEVDSLGWGVADASESLDMGPGSGGGMSGMDWTGRTRVLGTRNGFLAPAIAPTATIPAGGMSGPDPATRSPNSVVPPAGRR